MRKIALILGVLLLIAGGLISAGVFKYTTTEQVAKLGPLEITSKEEKKPPLNLGYVLMGAGAVLLIVGAVSRK